jgi:excisionase family DNA binding protein
MTGISRTKLYALIKDGQIATVKIGTATLIPVEGLRAFIKNHSH